MNEKFVESIYQTVIQEGEKTYRDLYENTEVTERTVDHWKNALGLYRALDDKQKEIFIEIIQQTMIDTISSVFGVLDGSSTLHGGDFEFDIKINGVSTEDELQDAFLEFVEENTK
ncbi:MAG: hypothetical protein J6B96_06170 [Agathobacter sp.]|nr:hypothetical protein [Agathobacter sp.]